MYAIFAVSHSLSQELFLLLVNYMGLPQNFGQNPKCIVFHREKNVEILADDWEPYFNMRRLKS